MKTKYLFISFIILISLLFTSCSFGASVEELLVAPSLSDNQKAVLSALEKEHPNRITFDILFQEATDQPFKSMTWIAMD